MWLFLRSLWSVLYIKRSRLYWRLYIRSNLLYLLLLFLLPIWCPLSLLRTLFLTRRPPIHHLLLPLIHQPVEHVAFDILNLSNSGLRVRIDHIEDRDQAGPPDVPEDHIPVPYLIGLIRLILLSPRVSLVQWRVWIAHLIRGIWKVTTLF